MKGSVQSAKVAEHGKPYRLEKSTAAVAPTKQNLIYSECYIRGHVAPKSIFSPPSQKQVTANYEKLFPSERDSASGAFYLRTKQLFGHRTW